MKNLEKAKELCCGCKGTKTYVCKRCMFQTELQDLVKIAEWKDKCFNEVIEHLRETYQLDEQVMFILKLVESRYNDKMK